MQKQRDVLFGKWETAVENSAARRRFVSGWDEQYWKSYAENYVRNRTSGKHYDRVLEWLKRKIPLNGTVIEIGPGPCVFTLALAEHCSSVTAVEPSPFLAGLLRKKSRKRDNVKVIADSWENATVPRHDIVFGAGILCVFHDIKAALDKMIQCARSRVLLATVAENNGLQREAASALKLPLPVPSLNTSLFLEILDGMKCSYRSDIFTATEVYRYPDIGVLLELWTEGKEIGKDDQRKIKEYLRERGIFKGCGHELEIPRSLTTHMIEIDTEQPVCKTKNRAGEKGGEGKQDSFKHEKHNAFKKKE
jgi:hypothetical protein